MIESPVIQEMVAEIRAEVKADTLLAILRTRFGTLPEDLTAAIQAIQDGEELDRLVDPAVLCPDLAAFRAKVHS